MIFVPLQVSSDLEKKSIESSFSKPSLNAAVWSLCKIVILRSSPIKSSRLMSGMRANLKILQSNCCFPWNLFRNHNKRKPRYLFDQLGAELKHNQSYLPILMLSVVNTNWSIVTRPDKGKPFWIMLDAVAYIAILSKYGRFNLSLEAFLVSGIKQRKVWIRRHSTKLFLSANSHRSKDVMQE